MPRAVPILGPRRSWMTARRRSLDLFISFYCREALIAADTQVLYTQSQQLFPGADDTVPMQMKIAIDQEARDAKLG